MSLRNLQYDFHLPWQQYDFHLPWLQKANLRTPCIETLVCHGCISVSHSDVEFCLHFEVFFSFDFQSFLMPYDWDF